MAAAKTLTVQFKKEKETKGTHMFLEEGERDTHKIGQLYVKRPACEELGNPEALEVTIKVK
jgi:hypothetical protein